MKYLAHLIAGHPCVAFAETAEAHRALVPALSHYLGSYDTFAAAYTKASAEADDLKASCSRHGEGKGSYVCGPCQEAILEVSLIASLAACRRPGAGRRSA